MTTSTQPPVSTSFEQGAKNLTELDLIYQMYSYALTIKRLEAPPNIPPDAPGMKQALSIPQLLTKAKTTAAKWDGHVAAMAPIASNISTYCKTSKSAIATLTKRTQEELNPTAFNQLSGDRKASLKREFSGILDGLKRQALKYAEEAGKVKNQLAAYQREIESDNEDAKKVKDKYADWLKQEAESLEAWEREVSVPKGETDKLLTKIQDDIATFQKTYAGLSVAAAAQGVASVTVAFMILPPLGSIGCLIGMSFTAVEADKMSKQIADFEERLTRIKRFNVVKTFFDTAETTINGLMNACRAAVQVLGEMQGQWEAIAGTLKGLGEDVGTINTLAGWGDPWENPIQDFQAEMVVSDYDKVIELCSHFVKYMYVKDIAA